LTKVDFPARIPSEMCGDCLTRANKEDPHIKESGKGWFAYFRFHGPTEPFFDKAWALRDFEKLN
jgi:hypothetical protein